MKERLRSILSTLLSSSRIPAIYAPIIKGLIENFLKDVSENELRDYVMQIRSEFIPWLLGEGEEQ
jgi:hypothetical protein